MTRSTLSALALAALCGCGSPLYLTPGDGGDASPGVDSKSDKNDAPSGFGGMIGAGGTAGTVGAGGAFGTGGLTGAGGTIGSGGAPGTGGGALGGSGAGGRGTGGAIGVGGAIGIGGMIGTGGRGTGGTINTQTDGQNCGVLGHDCLGGACTAGLCQPVLLGRYNHDLLTMAVGATYIYGKDDFTAIVRANKDGSDLTPNVVPSFATSACSQSRADEDGNRLFYLWYDGTSSGCRIAYCSTSDCDGTTMPITGPATYTFPFAIDHTNHRVFWEDQIALRFVVSPAAGTITGTTVTSSNLPNLPQDGRVLYAGGGLIFRDGQIINRLPASGGGITGLASATTPNNAFATNGTWIVWADAAGISYAVLPDAPGGSTTLLSVTGVRSLTVDSSRIYWSSTVSNRRLETCDLSGCASTRRTLAVPDCQIEDMGMDASAVYWVADGSCPNSGGVAADRSQLWKVAK